MNETPVTSIEETPARQRVTMHKDAYFYYPQNRAYLMGQESSLKVPNPLKYNRAFTVVVFIVLILSLLIAQDMGVSALLFGGVEIACLLLYQHWYNWRADITITKRSEREGAIIQGIVRRCIASVEGVKTPLFYIEIIYQFKVNQSKLVRNRIKEVRNGLSAEILPTAGTPIYVLYFNDQEYYLL